MTLPTQYKKITYLEEDEGIFEDYFGELLENISIKRTWKEAERDGEGIIQDTVKYQNLSINGVITRQTQSRNAIDIAKKISDEGNYISGDKILITTAILYLNNNENVNDVVVVANQEYNIVGKAIITKLIPHIVYYLKLKTKKSEISE